MSLAKSIQRGINSVTYNPEAEKALREERKKANEKRTEFRDGLYKLRDVKTDFIDKKLASPWYVKAMDKMIKDGFDWLKNNPDAEVDEIIDQASLTKDKWAQITKANDILIKVFVLTHVIKVNRDVLVKEKKINKETEGKINEYIDYAVNFSTKSLDLTPDQVLAKYAELEDKTLAIRDVIDINLKNPETQVKEAEKTKEKLVEEAKADKDSFNLKRLVTETSKIAAQVVGSLFIVMLFLVSGMLTANDAIARDPQYRILYFIYGGLGFPIMLVYYLYRWFFNSAPKIYRLIPIYTKESDTTLGRFLFFPFTYKEDQAAIDAKTKFMTEAAELVGKTYTPPAEKLGQNLEKFITKIQDLTLAPAKEATNMAVKGANTILKGLEKLELGK